jgi:hypothetical protein
VIFEPTRIRRKAKAEAEALVIMAEAEGEAKLIKERSRQRLEHLESRRQHNIESIVQQSIEEMTGKTNQEKLNPDWVAHFITNAQDTSDATVQHLWARILAGETEHPGRFSKRLLEFVKLISTDEAKVISAYCSHAWIIGDPSGDFNAAILVDELIHLNAPSASSGPFIDYRTRLTMAYLGVSNVESGLKLKFPKGEQAPFSICGRKYILSTSEGERALKVDLLTPLGKELLTLSSDVSPDAEYVEACIKQYRLEEVAS